MGAFAKNDDEEAGRGEGRALMKWGVSLSRGVFFYFLTFSFSTRIAIYTA